MKGAQIVNFTKCDRSVADLRGSKETLDPPLQVLLIVIRFTSSLPWVSVCSTDLQELDEKNNKTIVSIVTTKQQLLQKYSYQCSMFSVAPTLLLLINQNETRARVPLCFLWVFLCDI